MLLATFLIGLLGCLVFFLVLVAKQPASFSVTRGITIAAPPAAVFERVNDLHQWAAWSPWEKLDPAMKKTYSGSPAGADAVYAWEGNAKAGRGRMTITESRPAKVIEIKLEMMQPMSAVNAVAFTFEPVDGRTAVSWSMTGKKHFLMKAFCMFMNMDKMAGGDFERGLSQLKTVVESSPGVAASAATGGR